MTTPEGIVKDQIKKILKRYAPYVKYNMPVQNGMGKPTVDFTGCAGGLYFEIEAKAPGKALTPRQSLTFAETLLAGGKTFEINGDVQALDDLAAWMEYAIAQGPLQK